MNELWRVSLAKAVLGPVVLSSSHLLRVESQGLHRSRQGMWSWMCDDAQDLVGFQTVTQTRETKGLAH